MRAVVAEAGHLQLQDDLDEPRPGRGQVLVAPYATGVCGSDLHLLARQAEDPDLVGPIILGHEFCVEVIAYGPDTTELIPPGVAVCSVPFVDHETGAELTGLSSKLPGACAERMVLQADRLLAVPEGLDARIACLTEPLAVGIHAAAAADLQPGDCSLVLGAGPVGLAVIAALRIAARGPVLSAEFSPRRRQLAEAAGADIVTDPGETEPYDSLAEMSGPPLPPSPLLVDIAAHGRTVIFDCVGRPGLLAQIIAACPPHTRVVVVGACDRPERFVPLDAITKELQVSFVFAYRPTEFRHALSLLGDGRIDASRWITAVMNLEQAEAAVTAAALPDDHVKVLIEHRRATQ